MKLEITPEPSATERAAIVSALQARNESDRLERTAWADPDPEPGPFEVGHAVETS